MDIKQIATLTLEELGFSKDSTGIISCSLLANIAIEGENFGKHLYTKNRISGEQMGMLLASPAFKRMLVLKLRQMNDPRRPSLVIVGDVLKGWQEYDKRFLASGICNDQVQRHFHLCMMNMLFTAIIRMGATEDDLKDVSSSEEIFEATFFSD